MSLAKSDGVQLTTLTRTESPGMKASHARLSALKRPRFDAAPV